MGCLQVCMTSIVSSPPSMNSQVTHRRTVIDATIGRSCGWLLGELRVGFLVNGNIGGPKAHGWASCKVLIMRIKYGRGFCWVPGEWKHRSTLVQDPYDKIISTKSAYQKLDDYSLMASLLLMKTKMFCLIPNLVGFLGSRLME